MFYEKALLPTRGQPSGHFADAVGEVAERLVERRQLTDAAIDEVGALRVIQREQVRFDRNAHGFRGTRKLAQDGLTADDDDRVVLGDHRGGADQVLELLPGHGVWAKRSRVSRQICQRSRGFKAPAKGLDWRSSSASSLRSTRNAWIDGTSPARIAAHFRA